jgi:hypothetical protein
VVSEPGGGRVGVVVVGDPGASSLVCGRYFGNAWREERGRACTVITAAGGAAATRFSSHSGDELGGVNAIASAGSVGYVMLP